MKKSNIRLETIIMLSKSLDELYKLVRPGEKVIGYSQDIDKYISSLQTDDVNDKKVILEILFQAMQMDMEFRNTYIHLRESK